MTDIRFSQAASAYKDALRAAERILQKTGTTETSAVDANSGPSFLDMVGDSLKTAMNTGYKSEDISMRSLQGKADMTEVITAVANAEASLNTVVAIRDRVINAYQDIIKMPV